MPLTAVRHVRKMRGGAQAHLLEADDGHSYVVKFRNNPQHRRILVNELVASTLLGYLQISTPETGLIRLDAGFLTANPDLHLTLGSRRIAVEPGWHFGSRYPGDPAGPRFTTSFRTLSYSRWRTWRTSAPSWCSTSGWAMPTAGRAFSTAPWCAARSHPPGGGRLWRG